MEGGGTCRDVCKELGIEYEGRDLRRGFDATDAAAFARLGTFDFIWLHPPYWQMVRYNAGEPRCLSNAPTLDWFLEQLKRVFRNCRGALRPGGKLAVLMGDCRQQGRYLGLPFRVMNAAARSGSGSPPRKSSASATARPRPGSATPRRSSPGCTTSASCSSGCGRKLVERRA